MDLKYSFFLAFIFLSAIGIVLGINRLFEKYFGKNVEIINHRIKKLSSDSEFKIKSLVNEEKLNTSNIWDHILSKVLLITSIESLMSQAGIKINTKSFLIRTAVLSVSLSLVTDLF